MTITKTRIILTAILTTIPLMASVTAQKLHTDTPRVFILDAKKLAELKQKLTDPSLKPALARLERDAQKALTTEIVPVTAKTALPPSGDKHDYMSQAPYFWKKSEH